MRNTPNPRIAGLRFWADTPCECAAVELLIGFNDGHLVSGPWVRRGGFGSHWFDPDTAAKRSGHLSGGERRVLAVAMSLASAKYPVDLGDVLTGIDPKAFTVIVQAMGQAYGLTAPDDEKGA